MVPALVDEELNFGAMRMVLGGAFPESHNEDSSLLDDRSVPVAKAWSRVGDRTFLIEQMEYLRVRDRLREQGLQAALPAASKKAAVRTSRTFPPAPPQQALNSRGKSRIRPLASPAGSRLASVGRPAGFIIDWNMVSGQGLTIRGDGTYLVSGSVNLTNAILEGGAVIKYASPTAARIYLYGPLDCRTGPLSPVVFTSKDDDTIGTVIDGSTGQPTNYSGHIALWAATSLWVRPLRS
jgi:hypothetical protein